MIAGQKTSLSITCLMYTLRPVRILSTEAVMMIKGTRGFLSLGFMILLYCAQAQADPIVITFEGGTVGSPIGSTYAAQGVTFSNAKFETSSGFIPQSAVSFTGIVGPGPSTPIVIDFALLQSSVTLTAIDFSGEGFLMRAYDEGGNLLGQAGALTPPLFQPVTFSIEFNSALISYVELFQPLKTSNAFGVTFDNLILSGPAPDPTPNPTPDPTPAPVPEPASMILLTLGLSGVAARGARRKREARKKA
jgi:hypothetical protein